MGSASGVAVLQRFARRLLAPACSMLLGLAAAPLLAAPAPARPTLADDQQQRQAVSQALFMGDFDAVQRLHDTLLQAGAVDAGGTRNRFAQFMSGLDDVSDSSRFDALMVEQWRRLVAQQAARRPDLTVLPALQAQLLVEQAWKVRGSGFGKTVPPHAWEEFRRLLGEAVALLAARGEAALATPLAHSTLLVAARGLDYPLARIDAIVDDGMRRHPQAEIVVRQGLIARLPKWGGDARAVDSYIVRVSARSTHLPPDVMYALLYSLASTDDYSHQLFEDSHAQWPRMRAGYQALLSRHGHLPYRERLAYFACLARDRATFLEQNLPAAASDENLLAWGDNAAVTRQGCVRWATTQ